MHEQKYFIYVLKSERNGRMYVGYTQDLSERLARHNSGGVFSTKAHIPYKMVHFEMYNNERLARKRELFLKTGKGRQALSNILK